MWGRNWEFCWGVGEVSRMWEFMGEVWKRVWGECGGCAEVGKVCWDAERCGDVGELTHSSTPLPTPSTITRHLFHAHPTPLPRTLTLTRHVFPHSPPTYPHSLTLPHTHHTFPSPHPILFHTHSPYFLTTPTPLPTLPYAPHLPHAKISHFSHLLPS